MKVNLKLGELLRRQLGSRQAMTQCFRIDAPDQEVLDTLLKNYIYNVTRRGLTPNLDETTVANLEAVAAALVAQDAKRGIWLYGTVGNGKTTMLYSISQTISEFRNAFGHMGEYFDPRPVFRTAVQVCEVFREREERKEEWRQLMTCDVLCIDDLGAEPKEVMVYGNVITPMTDVLAERYRLQRITFVSSNLTPAQIGAKYDERIADRCREMFVPVKFLASTYRRG